jgi:hypothetical protein
VHTKDHPLQFLRSCEEFEDSKLESASSCLDF